MKKLTQLLFFTLSLLTLFSCKKEEVQYPVNHPNNKTDGKSIFMIDYKHSGDIEAFYKTFAFGDGFLFYDSKQDAPIAFDDSNFIDSFQIATKEPEQELNLNLAYKSNDHYNTKYSEMFIKIKIYRDSVLIDSLDLSVSSNDTHLVDDFEYEGL